MHKFRNNRILHCLTKGRHGDGVPASPGYATATAETQTLNCFTYVIINVNLPL